jgi:hypothetical protein
MTIDSQRRRTPMNGERSTRLRDAALAAANSGLWVFPCIPRGKVPAVKDWEQTATQDPALIEKWWRQRPFNIGAAVGRSGLIVIDLDQGHGEPAPERFAGATSGMDVLRMLALRAGQPVPWETYSVSSPTVINGTEGRSLRCSRRSAMTVFHLVEAGLSGVVLRRGVTAAACADGGLL